MKNIAYCWYRPVHEPFSPGKILNLITDKQVISRYVPEPEYLALAYKYFPDGLSIHGLSSLPIRPKHARDFWEPIVEITFELVRRHDFPNAPSRLTSLYASQSLEQAEQWRQLWQGNFGNMPDQTGQSLWEIEYETDAKLYDAAWLDAALDGDKRGSLFSYLLFMESAHQYWSGSFTTAPKPELLIPFPATVLREFRGGNPG